VVSAVYGQFQRWLNGQNLKCGVVVATVAALVVANNHQKVADQDHMLVKLFE
jgi:hypothetical protein